MDRIPKDVPEDKKCECCGGLKVSHWNPSLGFYWVCMGVGK